MKGTTSTNLIARIGSSGQRPKVWDANSKPLSISERVTLFVHLGPSKEYVTLLVSERLPAPMILGSNYEEKNIEAIKPRMNMGAEGMRLEYGILHPREVLTEVANRTQKHASTASQDIEDNRHRFYQTSTQLLEMHIKTVMQKIMQ